MKNIDDMTGSDIRNYIKQMWKHDKKVYDELIDQYMIVYDRLLRGNRSEFHNLDRIRKYTECVHLSRLISDKNCN